MDIKEKNTSPKKECEFLAGILLPIAEKQIKRYGEFYPFGAVLTNNDSVETTDTFDGNDYPAANKIMEILTNTHKQMADEGKIKASGIAWKTVMKNSDGEDVDAIMVSLEHKNNYSVMAAEPYKVVGFFKKGIFKIVKFDDLRAFEGKHEVF